MASSTTTAGLIPVKAITDQGYSLAEVEAAIANSPYLSLGQAPVVTGHGGITPQGVTFGAYIYVRCSQRVAKALQVADVATVIAILGLATGGIGLVIATAVFTFMGSINDDYLNQCANWEFRFTYPTPWSGSQLASASCYYP
ncbi:hypothetical protein [Cellulomonas sp. SG140]|uniref:hypothetical protein n=1 Tax=Cellulomonas sp. SG140 TaxID=2976536 RepID=UPI0021E6DF14|nr:hypothetical protein [Cellulomonas sp. SG140]